MLEAEHTVEYSVNDLSIKRVKHSAEMRRALFNGACVDVPDG